MLTDSQIKKIKPTPDKKSPDRYNDGNGLYLHVFSAGGKRWIMDYRFEGKRKSYSIGTYPDVSLANAREKRDDARKLLTQGIDPSVTKKLKQLDDAGHNSFKHVALQWVAKKSSSWAESTATKISRRFVVDVFPYIGKLPIADVTAPDLLRVIQRIETRSVDTAYRALEECGQIFRYGMAIGSNIHDPSVALRGALSARPNKHFAAIIEPNEAGQLLRAIDSFNGSFVVKCALQLAPLFFARIGELRRAKWQEIDFEACEWRYVVTKTKQDHIVPLSSQAILILRDLQQLTGQYEYVFIGGRDPKRPMSDGAINAALRRMGYDTKNEMTGHGFRAMARTILHERLGLDRDVIEHQLAHRVSDALGTAYNRTKFVAQRKMMMQTWSDYLYELKGGKVIQFPKMAI
jgi:integrase